MQKVIAKIYLENIRSNAKTFKARSGKLCAVVKADAYGHGAEEVTLALSDIADLFAVALLDEGIAIRAAACGKDILVFTPPQTEEEGYAFAANGFIASVPNLATAKLLVGVSRKYRLPVRVHLKVNTGMNRYGADPSTLGKICRLLEREEYVKVEGLYSHLYECNLQTAEAQRQRFLQMQKICRRYFSSFISHLGATYGAMLGEKFAFDTVRVGIGLYGYTPIESELSLKKGMQVFARAVERRNYAFGGVGYGNATLEKGAPLTAYRVGYADGFLRRKDNGTAGWERNANNLCMDVCLRQEKGICGKYYPVLIDADETAKATGTISYEVLCAATRRAERIFQEE